MPNIKAKAICDGRGNAGTGARAVVLIMEDGKTYEYAEKLPPCTNIVAEHLAIQLAVEKALAHGVAELLVWNDSRSPVNHVLGIYRCEKEHLRPILEKTRELASALDSFTIEWVPRERTTLADKLCRQVDPKTPAV